MVNWVKVGIGIALLGLAVVLIFLTPFIPILDEGAAGILGLMLIISGLQEA